MGILGVGNSYQICKKETDSPLRSHVTYPACRYLSRQCAMASLGPQRTREMILAATSTACLMGWAEVCSRHASPVRVISPPRPMAFQFIHVFPNAWQPFCLMTMIAPFSGQAGFCACCSVTHSRAYQAVRVKARSCHFFCGKAATQGKPYLSLRRLFDLS